MVGRIRAGGVYARVGETVCNTFKGGGKKQRGRDKKILKRGGQSGSRGGCLKKAGGLEPPYELWGAWATLYEILAIKISKNMLNQQKFNKIIWFRTLISPKTVSHSIINNYHFLKVQKETFQMHICKLL